MRIHPHSFHRRGLECREEDAEAGKRWKCRRGNDDEEARGIEEERWVEEKEERRIEDKEQRRDDKGGTRR